jgi:hypothetical protein
MSWRKACSPKRSANAVWIREKQRFCRVVGFIARRLLLRTAVDGRTKIQPDGTGHLRLTLLCHCVQVEMLSPAERLRTVVPPGCV